MSQTILKPLAILLAGFFLSAIAMAAAETYRVLDRKKIYYGSPDSFAVPAVLDAKKVMAKLPAMQKIEAESVAKESARWYVLMHEANQQFKKALKSVAKDSGYDLIAESGAVVATKNIADVTDLVLTAAAKG